MIGFRVDANEKIATGHMMRCIAIAQKCISLGEKCIFFLAEEKETDRLKEKNIPYRVLNTKWDDMESEEMIMKQIIEEEKLDWLVVDSYQATVSYLAYLEQFVSVLYIDDMAEEIYPVSAVLHYSQWQEECGYTENYRERKTRVLAGMQYAPLREEFSRKENQITEREKSILITTGGTDPYNVTGSLLRICCTRKELEDYKFHVIVGNMNQHESELKKLAVQDLRICLHKNIKNMSDYMQKCQVAVSAGGTTLYELCACKIPTVCFSFADNQRDFVEAMGKQRIMICAGDVRDGGEIENEILKGVLFFAEQETVREEYSDRMSRLIDGQGSARIADFLCKGSSRR